MAAYNHISPDALLQVGQELLIHPPTATPEPTPTVTASATPEEVHLGPAETPVVSPTAKATAVALVMPEEVASESGGRDWGNVLGIGAIIAGVALTVLAGVAILVLWRNE